MKTNLPILCVALSLAFMFTGCGDSGTSSNAAKRQVHKAPDAAALKLAFVTNNASEFWKIASKGLDKFEKETGIKVTMKQPPTGTAAEQKKIMEDLASQGYHGMAISPVDASAQTGDLNDACKVMNVICQDSDADKSNRLAYIGTNNFDAGKALGEELKKRVPGGGKAAVFVGTFTAANARQRLEGIEAALKGSNIEIVAKKEDNKVSVKAQTNVEDVMNAYADVTILLGLWSYNTPSIAAAVSSSPKKGKIIIAGFDEEEATLNGIEKGEIIFTVVQKPFEFGYRSAKLLYELSKNGESALPKDPIIDTGIEVIDSKNVADFKARLAELKK
jgi:ribose transport system substrate-binding protein